MALTLLAWIQNRDKKGEYITLTIIENKVGNDNLQNRELNIPLKHSARRLSRIFTMYNPANRKIRLIRLSQISSRNKIYG